MGIYDQIVEVPRRTMVLFFLVDTSGSMRGEKIGTVNSAVEEIVPVLKDISESNADAQIKVATLAFSTGARWIEDAPVAAEDFRWNYLNADGVTDLGEACRQLNDKLSRNEFMSDATGSFAPAIFLMSDGAPTDDYKRGLEKLKQNKWFKKAIRVAIAIGRDVNEDVLAEFTGNMEAVIHAHNPEALRKWIQFVSVRASEIGSKSANAGNEPTNPLASPATGDNILGTDGSEEAADVGAVAVVSKQEEFIKEIQDLKEDAEEWESEDDVDEW